MSLLILNAKETRRLLPIAECIDVMEQAMHAASSQSIRIPPRTLFYLQDDSGFFAVMPGASKLMNSYGAKLVGYHPGNARRNLPVIRGIVALFDHETGEPQAIIDGGTVTNIRTAAASGLATRVLARPDAKTCGILGAGALAAEHVDAMARSVKCWRPTSPDKPGRRNDAQVTVYNSPGITAQDLYAAQYVLAQARREGIGSSVPF
ncbi:MAG: hypothetical protein RQ826_06340 [Xanthomonadales bacterium]|nr:hypothetical protein [Xanthomonadales bacterium]